jgi:cytochrome bd-type quinol oxidase subunit 2
MTSIDTNPANAAVHEPLRHLARDLAMRAAVAVGLAGIALIHLLDSIGKYHETRYVFWLYVALMVASVVTAGVVLTHHSRLAWSAAGALAAGAIAGYVLSRTTGLPNAKDDIGNWTEPLGLASLFVEGCVVALSVYALGVSRFTRTLWQAPVDGRPAPRVGAAGQPAWRASSR